MDYASRVEKVLSYTPKRLNGRSTLECLRVNMLSSTLKAWQKSPISADLLKQQGYKEIIAVGDRCYPLSLIEEMEQLRRQYPKCFEE